MCCPRRWPRPSTWSSRHDRRCRVTLRGRVGGETDERQIESDAPGRPGRRSRSARPPLWPAPNNLRAHVFRPLDNERNHEPARELLHPFGRARGPRDRLDGPGEIGTVRRLPAPERACHRNARFPGPLRPVRAAAGRRVRRAAGQIEVEIESSGRGLSKNRSSKARNGSRPVCSFRIRARGGDIRRRILSGRRRESCTMVARRPWNTPPPAGRHSIGRVLGHRSASRPIDTMRVVRPARRAVPEKRRFEVDRSCALARSSLAVGTAAPAHQIPVRRTKPCCSS